MEFIESAPSYWLRDGGNHISLEGSAGFSVSALRSHSGADWAVFDGFGVQSSLVSSVSFADVKGYLKDIALHGLQVLMAQVRQAK